MIELYAITDAASPPLPDNAPLRTVAAGELIAICAPAARGEVTAEQLWRHEELVEALMADRDLLPVRYGTRVDREESVIRILEQNCERLRERLEFVRGGIELSVRAYMAGGLYTESDGNGPTTGTEYLLGRAGALANERDALRAVHEPLAAAARAAALRQPNASGEVIRAAYLLDRDAVPGFSELVAQLQADNPALRLVCTGPWPPYSFADR